MVNPISIISGLPEASLFPCLSRSSSSVYGLWHLFHSAPALRETHCPTVKMAQNPQMVHSVPPHPLSLHPASAPASATSSHTTCSDLLQGPSQAPANHDKSQQHSASIFLHRGQACFMYGCSKWWCESSSSKLSRSEDILPIPIFADNFFLDA